MSCAFAHCKHLRTLQLPGKLRKIQQEAFLKCTSLTEVQVPPPLLYFARRAFGGCTQLNRFERTDQSLTWRGAYARANAFLQCDNLDMPKWVRWLPRSKKMMISGQIPLLPSIKGTLWQCDGQALVGTCVQAWSGSCAPVECTKRVQMCPLSIKKLPRRAQARVPVTWT